MLQSARVVQPQTLHIHDLKSRFADLRIDHGQVRQFAVGENVPADELPRAPAHRTAVRVPGRDAVVHYQTSLANSAAKALAIQPQVGVANVLEHAHTDDLVEASILRQVTIIEQLQFDLMLQAFGHYSRPSQLQLLLAQGNAQHSCAELARRESCQATPTAADIQKVITLSQSQFAAQVSELVLLRLLQGLLTGMEVGAGVRHVPVEPELIELVGQVVVIGDRAFIGAFVMCRAHGCSAIVVVQNRLAEFIAQADDVADLAFDIHLAFDEGTTQSIQARVGKLADDLRLFQYERDAGRWTQIQFVSVPETQP